MTEGKYEHTHRYTSSGVRMSGHKYWFVLQKHVLSALLLPMYIWEKTQCPCNTATSAHVIASNNTSWIRIMVSSYQCSSTLIPAWIYDHKNYEMWIEFTYPFPNFNGCPVEVCEWISNFTPRFTGYVITYPCWDYSHPMLVKWAPCPNTEAYNTPSDDNLNNYLCCSITNEILYMSQWHIWLWLAQSKGQCKKIHVKLTEINPIWPMTEDVKTRRLRGVQVTAG